MKKSFSPVWIFHETHVAGTVTMPVSSVRDAPMPSTPTFNWMPFSPRTPTFSIQVHARVPWKMLPESPSNW